MFAAITAAEKGNEVHLYEKNEKLGKKLYITGKGRCNLTNACDMEKLIESVCTNRKFLYSAFYGYTNQNVIDFFENHGMQTKTERGGRVFPLSDRSADVIDTLRNAMKAAGVKVHLNAEVDMIFLTGKGEKKITGIRLKDGAEMSADCVLVATGGLSYQTTGSTGDGFRFAEEAGHKVTERSPSLVPFNTREEYGKRMQGLSLKNVEFSVYDGKKCLYEDFGEMMFTHFGITGPLILPAQRYRNNFVRKNCRS